jgi:hypothetical protein
MKCRKKRWKVIFWTLLEVLNKSNKILNQKRSDVNSTQGIPNGSQTHDEPLSCITKLWQRCR